MSSPDPPRPPAAPTPFAWPPSVAASEPTSTVSASEASWSHPAGTASPDAGADAAGDAFTDRPEVQVGAAFVGGFFAALILKRVGR